MDFANRKVKFLVYARRNRDILYAKDDQHSKRTSI